MHDYKIWRVLQERVYYGRISDIEHLMLKVMEEWDKLEHSIVVEAIQHWRKRLLARVIADTLSFNSEVFYTEITMEERKIIIKR